MPRYIVIMYVVYMLRCVDNTLYTGIARDVERRIREHNEGARGARYTRGRRPVQLVYEERQVSRSMALKREAALKKLSRTQKDALIGRRGS